MAIAHIGCTAQAEAQSPNLIGRWNVEITFANGNQRSLRFDAQDSGKGTFLLLDPKLKVCDTFHRALWFGAAITWGTTLATNTDS